MRRKWLRFVYTEILTYIYNQIFFLTESNSFISLYASSGKSSNCFLTYAMLYASTFPPLLFTFPTLISTFPTLISTFLNYFFLIPSSVVTNLMQFQGMGTHPSVFSINKKEICFFEHSSDGGGEIRTQPSQTGDRCSTDELFQPLTRSTLFLDYIYVIYAY